MLSDAWVNDVSGVETESSRLDDRLQFSNNYNKVVDDLAKQRKIKGR